MPVVAAVTGFAAEARLLRRHGMRVGCSGASPQRAEAQARALIAAGATGLLSFGIAGGLDPDLGPGRLVVAMEVVDDTERYRPDDAWVRWALATLPAAVAGVVAGQDALAATPAVKQSLRARSGAAVVDMESHHVARVAAAAGLPFLVVRAVADPAGAGLPDSARVGLRPDGRIAVGATLRAFARTPGEIGPALRAAWATRAALRALAGCAAPLAAWRGG